MRRLFRNFHFLLIKNNVEDSNKTRDLWMSSCYKDFYRSLPWWYYLYKSNKLLTVTISLQLWFGRNKRKDTILRTQRQSTGACITRCSLVLLVLLLLLFRPRYYRFSGKDGEFRMPRLLIKLVSSVGVTQLRLFYTKLIYNAVLVCLITLVCRSI